MFNNIRIFQDATGGLANVSKFEGLRYGRSRHAYLDREFSSHIRAAPYLCQGGEVKLGLQVPKGYGIQWCQRGCYVVSLGIPHAPVGVLARVLANR